LVLKDWGLSEFRIKVQTKPIRLIQKSEKSKFRQMISLFASSRQKGLVQERLTVLEWIASDSILRKLFKRFPFEKLPALEITPHHIF
jgi:hypothetical protein